MRRIRAGSPNYRLQAFRYRQMINLKNNEPQNNDSESDRFPEIASSSGWRNSALHRRKLLTKVQRKLRNIKNMIGFCFYTIGEIFSHTFCFIMVKRTKTKGVLKTVKI